MFSMFRFLMGDKSVVCRIIRLLILILTIYVSYVLTHMIGKRKKRGLFQSSIGKLLNADINGAIGIGRKVFGDSYVSKIIGSGLAFNPVRVNIL